MAYRRRYFAPLTITTVAYAEKSVTTDKIADEAVTSPKVAPDTIDSEHVVDESLKSKDIKDGEIKNSDLASNSVSTSKLQDGSVTIPKLESAIQGIARPLTPGVDTAEIQDGKVTLAKLAPDSVDASKIKPGACGASELAVDAVETSRVKDGAISTAKIAGSAIDATKIAVNAVTGSEILNGSVGNLELATDSVRTVKVLDANITLPKLAPNSVDGSKIAANAVAEPHLAVNALSRRHRESFDVHVATYKEDFGGIDITDRWRKRMDAGGVFGWSSVRKSLYLQTPNTINKGCILDWGGNGFEPNGQPLTMVFWLPNDTGDLDYQLRELGLVYVFDKSSYILFTAEDAVGAVPNWFVRCKEGGVETAEDTGIAITEAIQVLVIRYVSDAEVTFHIDGALVKTITTNIPSGHNLDPYIAMTAKSNATRVLHVQAMSLLHDRPAYA